MSSVPPRGSGERGRGLGQAKCFSWRQTGAGDDGHEGDDEYSPCGGGVFDPDFWFYC
jgi:hypothetical protein